MVLWRKEEPGSLWGSADLKIKEMRRKRIMGKRVLVVVDMQKDFVDGSLGSKEAVSIVPASGKKGQRL